MKLIDITPTKYQCAPFPGCPAIFLTSRGTYIVIGKNVSVWEIKELKLRMAGDENAVEIPRGILDSLFE